MLRMNSVYWTYRVKYKKPVRSVKELRLTKSSFGYELAQVRIVAKFYGNNSGKKQRGDTIFYEYEFVDGEVRFNCYDTADIFYRTYHAGMCDYSVLDKLYHQL